ncbi:type II secretion system F family protein [Algiphilus sp.]|uniref:type II secretion system F family protein n=1 Tax=Algiphilus sp. TaxID=1872431 RepID=UPI0025C66FB5|nr:type II secretion system F family protein [Algiphilus sp.]MCK5770077.1 type II secretion system F family protein [Algiphilus sp.]
MAQAVGKDVLFRWEGTDRKGKRVKGQTSGRSETDVKRALRKQGINPLRVRKQSSLFGSGKRKIKSEDIAVFSRQMATMMAAGLPLVQALELVGQGHENPTMGELVLALKTDVEAGNSFAEALGRHPVYFDDLFVNLVDAGEKSGTLETLLDKVALYKEKTEAIRKKVKKALTYPAAVVAVAFIVTGILLYFVVPQFQDLFQGFGADLPVFTLMVIALSQFVQEWWWVILLGLGATAYGFTFIKKRSPAFRRLLDRIALRLPIVGVILHKSALARYHRTLSTMFAAGVPLVEALDPVARASGNIIFEEAVYGIRDEVASGTQLYQGMQGAGLFPPMATQMVAIGEESGSLDAMCAKVADYYESEVDAMVDSLSSLLEPLIMVVLGILVGGLVVAMYLPIFQLGQVV